jgi:hypothetical protein
MWLRATEGGCECITVLVECDYGVHLGRVDVYWVPWGVCGAMEGSAVRSDVAAVCPLNWHGAVVVVLGVVECLTRWVIEEWVSAIAFLGWSGPLP